MKKSHEAHAARFDEKAADYDDDTSDEYRACVSLVVDYAAPGPEDVVLDLGCGTGAIGLRLAGDAARVIGRDISEGMMEQARAKADERAIANITFGEGTFRTPNVDGTVDIVVSNFAMHHLSDADLDPRRFVLGDVMFFGEPDAEAPFFSPEVDDPATVGVLADALTAAGISLTAVEMVHDQVGVLVAERSA